MLSSLSGAGEAAGAEQRAAGWKTHTDNPAHLLTTVRGCQQCCCSELCSSTHAMAGAEALAGFPRQWPCHVPAGQGGQRGDALGAGTPPRGRAAKSWNIFCSWAVSWQKNGDEAVRSQVIPHFAQLTRGWGGTAGLQACRRLSKTTARRCPSHLLMSLATEAERHLQPACEAWGQCFLASLHLHNLWC